MKQRMIATILLVLALSMSACSVRQTKEETSKTTRRAEETTRPEETEQTEPWTEEDTTAAQTTVDDEEDTTANHSEKHITEEEALAAAKAYLGDKDPDVGYSYSFVSQGTMEDAETGESFYKVRVSWYLPEDDRYSVCGYLLVSRDGKTVTKFDW